MKLPFTPSKEALIQVIMNKGYCTSVVKDCMKYDSLTCCSRCIVNKHHTYLNVKELIFDRYYQACKLYSSLYTMEGLFEELL